MVESDHIAYVTGEVVSVMFVPGDEAGTLFVEYRKGEEYASHKIAVICKDPASRVNFNAFTSVELQNLLGLLTVYSKVTIEAWPLPERYGAALKADFKTS